MVKVSAATVAEDMAGVAWMLQVTSIQCLVHYGADKTKIHQYLYSNYYEKDILDAPILDKNELRKKYLKDIVFVWTN